MEKLFIRSLPNLSEDGLFLLFYEIGEHWSIFKFVTLYRDQTRIFSSFEEKSEVYQGY